MFRLVWLSIAVIMLGLLTRWELVFMLVPDGVSFTSAQLTISHSKTSLFSFRQLIEHLSMLHLWIEWGTLFALSLFLIWRVVKNHFVSYSFVVALYLSLGAIFSLAGDIYFYGQFQDYIQLTFSDSISLHLSIPLFILLITLGYLTIRVLTKSWRIQSQFKLSPSRIPQVQISSLSKGVDNIHIDVLLSGKFCKSSNLIIHNLIPIVVQEFQAGKRSARIPKNQLKPLHDIFSPMVEQTLRRAKESGEKELIELMLIAVFKHVHEEVDRTVDSYLRDRTGSSHHNSQINMGGDKARLFIETLSRHKEDISATVNEIVLNSLRDHHSLPFQKALKSFLGIKDGFALRLIQTPLALSGYHHSDQLLMNHYLLTGMRRKDENHFFEVDRILSRLFQSYTPLINNDDGLENGTTAHDELVNEKVELLLQPSVFMGSTNIKKLLDTEWTKQQLEQAKVAKNRAHRRKLNKHLQFQEQVIEKLERELVALPMHKWLVAAYQVKYVLQQSNSDVSPSALAKLIVLSETSEELETKLNKSTASAVRFPDIQKIRNAWHIVHEKSQQYIHANLLRIIKDFSKYRRHLLLQSQLKQGANQIRFLSEKRDIQTSRANFTLHDFSISSEITEDRGQVRAHIIIKADLRGSTQITERLVEMSLNPASHFERNFFTPVNELIALYGAEKVFIEGDAIILILNDYEGKSSNHHIASRACGLAANILKVVAAQNKNLQPHGLPELELGIGIAYCAESPRYLFDEDHRITISPAINKADRLSACAWSIREWRDKQAAPLTHVEVYQPSKSAEAVGEKAQKDLVFNLNGILIESEVFDKLEKEVSLKRVVNRVTNMKDSTLYSLVFPDLSGDVHRMIVRKAPVKLYEQNKTINESPIVANRYFYEVVYKKEILNQLRK